MASKHAEEKVKKIKKQNKAVKNTASKKNTMRTSTIEVVVNQVPAKNQQTKIKSETQKNKKSKTKNQSKKSKQKKQPQNTVIKKQKKVKKGKSKIKSKIIKFLGIICLIVVAGIFLCTTPLFNITAIEVLGNETVSSDEIISLSQIKLNENMFKNIKSKIKQNVKGNAYIEDVDVKMVLPNKMQIIVQERPVKFMAKLLENYAYINSQGYILEITGQTKEVPLLEGLTTPEEEIIVGKRLNNDDLSNLEVALKIMSSAEKNEISRYITSIDLKNQSEYTMNLVEKGVIVHLGNSSNLDTKMLYVKAILEEKEGIEGDIFVNGDLNNGFQTYFRMKV